MNIELSDKEFRRLLDMVYIGNWILNSARGEDRFADYDELQEKYIACCTDTPWALPKTFTPEQEEIAGTVIEAISAYNYKNMLPVYLESTLKSRLADEPDDAEMLQLIADTRTIGFAYAFQLIGNDFLENMYSNSVGVASFLKKLEQKAEKGLAKLLDSYAD